MKIPGLLGLPTSTFVSRVSLPTSGFAEVIGSNMKRIAFLVSSANSDYSLSWQPGLILGRATLNFFSDIPSPFLATFWLFGSAIQQPLFGIGSVESQTIEVTEFLYSGVGNIQDLCLDEI